MSRLVRITAAIRERLRGVFLRKRVESEMDDELRFHMEMEAAKLARSGIEDDEARRRAAATFGGVERYKEEVRDARGLAWIPGMRLDFALGLRMMKKHPSLSVVGGIGMAVGIAVAVGMFAFIRANIYPVLPLDEGQRIVALENRDVDVNNEERRALHDFHLWRGELKTVEDLGAYRDVVRNVGFGEGEEQPEQMAEMTAAGFAVARVAPFMGRYLLPDDERAEAPPVVVIGHEIWRTQFGSRADIVGRPLRIAGVPHTIIGVMPEDFGFPMYHRLWVPLRANPNAFERRKGPAIYIFGRLAEGATLETAQVELAAIGKRVAATYPQNAKLEPMVMPYIHSLTDIQGISNWEVASMQAMMTVLLIVIALNVAMLVYARTAMRQGEIAVRTALGASRRRIVGQLFIEALTLCICSALAGLGIAQVGVRLGNRIMESEAGGLPFWVSYGLDPWVIVFTIGVTVFAALIVGALPALQATGKRLQVSLRELGGSAMRLGRTWTTLVVAQIAIAVAVLPAAVSFAWTEIRSAFTERTYDAREYASGYLQVDGDVEATGTEQSRRPMGERVVEIVRRIEEDPSIVGATYWAALPGRGGRVEVEGVAPPPGAIGWRVATTGGGANYLDFYDSKILAGRALGTSDADSLSTAVVVNRSFVDQILPDSQVLGRRIRYAARPAVGRATATEASRWYQIVGVVENDRINTLAPEIILPEIYYVASPSQLAIAEQIYVEVRMRGTTAPVIAPRLRAIITQVDPTIRLGVMESQSDLDNQMDFIVRLIGLGLGLVLMSVFLLSAAGVYALVSFTVTRRRKEIGIRAALGASQRQVIMAVLGPVARQIALGLIIGIAGAAAIDRVSDGGLFSGKAGLLLPVFGALMIMVALGAAFGPARRGLKTQPTEALRAEA